MNSTKYTNYFKHIGDEVKDNKKYSIYQPYGFPLILKNYQGRVLASLQIFYDDEPIVSQTYPIPVPYQDTFQVIFQSKDDDERIEKGRPIKYVITNHCEEQGYVKIDLGFNKVPSCETDPPENINNVNELRSFEPFEVKSNQLDNWKELIVKTKKVKQSDGSFKTISFEEETKTEETKKVGSYLYITVTPQNYPQLVELFKNTYWTTDEFIVIETKQQTLYGYHTSRFYDNVRIRSPYNQQYEFAHINQPVLAAPARGVYQRHYGLENLEAPPARQFERKKNKLLGANLTGKIVNKETNLILDSIVPEIDVIENLETKEKTGSGIMQKLSSFGKSIFGSKEPIIQARPVYPMIQATACSASACTSTTNKKEIDSDSAVDTHQVMRGGYRKNITRRGLDSDISDDSDNSCDGYRGRSSRLTKTKNESTLSVKVVKESDGDTDGDLEGELNNNFNITEETENISMKQDISLLTTKEATETAQKDIMVSKVAELATGERIITQNGNKTFANYDYTCRSEPRKIGMSIMDLNITKIYTDMTKDEINSTINDYLDNIEKSKSIEIIELAKSIKKFRADVCTICLGDPPNTILVRCGHICTCSKDCTEMLGDNCPMCRSKILHRIDESLFTKTE
jgi:hypothetical protein